jgi:hypothetical protein
MKSANALLIGIFLVTFSGFFPGCVTDTATLKIKKSLPQNKLAYYNDSFDKLRTDLWDKAGYAHNKAQEANFKLAKMEIKDGKLWVRTETGCFSKGGLTSKYTLRGDFDIQVDCQIDFLKGLYDMDQSLNFLVIEKGTAIGKDNTVFLCLYKKGGRDFSTIFSAVRKNGRFHRGDWYKIKNFDGGLRIVRIGDEISTLFKRKGDTEWKKMDTFQSTPKDIILGFKLQNFVTNRSSITARSPITATFDNFRINAAEEIIEEEI